MSFEHDVRCTILPIRHCTGNKGCLTPWGVVTALPPLQVVQHNTMDNRNSEGIELRGRRRRREQEEEEEKERK